VEKVRVHTRASAADADAGWSEVVPATPQRVNLLDLTNGAVADLGRATLPPGKYQQLRLMLAVNGAANPLANSVVSNGAAETALSVTSADQTGIKVALDLDVAAGKTADLVLDFDACKSVVRRGNTGHFDLKPTVAATNVSSGIGTVIGYVDKALGVDTTVVSIQADGVQVKATLPDESGRFVLYPVPAGTYDLVVAPARHVTMLMGGVPVVEAATTAVNSRALPFASPLSTVRTVNGTLGDASGTVRATQTYGGGPRIEVAWGAVDSSSGAFTFALPVDAPWRTLYAADPVALGFVPDAAIAGTYTLEAVTAGGAKSSPINVLLPGPPITLVIP
ncbi:MAG: DUF4382 domain-containing protein, partial [Caldimonas sp.]